MRLLIVAMLLATAILTWWGRRRSERHLPPAPVTHTVQREPPIGGHRPSGRLDPRLPGAIAALQRGGGHPPEQSAVEPPTELGRLYLADPEKALTLMQASNEVKRATAELAHRCVADGAPRSTIAFRLRLGIVGGAGAEKALAELESYEISDGAPLAEEMRRCLELGMADLQRGQRLLTDRSGSLTENWPVIVGR
jgi:hypothetical protein